MAALTRAVVTLVAYPNRQPPHSLHFDYRLLSDQHVLRQWLRGATQTYVCRTWSPAGRGYFDFSPIQRSGGWQENRRHPEKRYQGGQHCPRVYLDLQGHLAVPTLYWHRWSGPENRYGDNDRSLDDHDCLLSPSIPLSHLQKNTN